MIKQVVNKLEYLQFGNFSRYDGINHFTTTRIGGVSKNHLFGLNLGYSVGDSPKFVDENNKMLAHAVGIEHDQMVFPGQTNGSNIGIVNSREDTFPDTDALITAEKGICIGVKTADCVPVLLYDTVRKVIAAIHSGWRGTVQKISEKTIKIMQNEFGTKPEDIIAGIGPSIGPDIYEVGTDVIRLIESGFTASDLLKPIPNTKKAYLNLWEANRLVLIESGIPEKQIEIARICTYANAELFYSARRDKNNTGRLASGIMLK